MELLSSSSSNSVRGFSGGCDTSTWLQDSLSAVDAWPERAEWRVLVFQIHKVIHMASPLPPLSAYPPVHGEASSPNLDHPASALLRLLHDLSVYVHSEGKNDSDVVRRSALLDYRRRLELDLAPLVDAQTEPSMSSRCPSQVPSSSGTSTWSSRPSRQSSSYEQTGSCMSSRDNDFLMPSPSPLTFTFTKTSPNSFALEEEDILPSPARGRAANWPTSASSSLISSTGGRAGSVRPQQTSTPRTIRRSRSDLPPRALRTGVAPAYFRQGGLFDLHEGDLQNEHVRPPVSSPQRPGNTNDTPFPTTGECKLTPPQPLRHRHSTSLPTYPPTSIPPERPPKSTARSAISPILPSTTSRSMQLVPDQLPFSSPPNLQAFSYPSSHALSTSDFSSSTSAIHPYTEPIYHHPHGNDSWEVIHESRIFKPIIPGTYKRPKTPKSTKQTKPPTKSPKLPLLPITPATPRMPILHAGSTPHLSIPTPTATPPVITKGYDSEGLTPRLRGLRQRISKGAQLHIRTGSLSSLATLGSTLSSPVKQPHNLTLINVNMVVMGPQGSGVSSLIYRFINGANGWVAPATVDDFWHHVVRSKSEERIIYYNITEVTGEEEYEGHRKSMLRRAQVVMLCFRLDRKVQFKRDVKRLLSDIASIGQIPVILVGTHHDSPQRAVSYDEALTFARSIQATYFESSAPLGRGVNEIFTAAVNIQHASELLTIPHSPPPSASKSFFERMRRKTSPSSPPAGPHGAWAGRRAFKCVVLGGKSSGKANMVHRYLHGVFEWLPEVPWMTWKASVKLDDDEEGETPYALSIAEVGSARQYDYLRQQTYAGANAFLLCFDVGDYRDETMKEVRERWTAECRSHGAHIPIILVGTKIDQRQGTLRAFTPEQGRALATSIRAAAYLECSALNGEGVDLVFQTIVRVASGLMV